MPRELANRCSLLVSDSERTVDWRLLFVLFPIVAALSWVVYIIGRAALGQLQTTLKGLR